MTQISNELMLEEKTRRRLSWKRIKWFHVFSYIVLIILTIVYIGPLLMLVNTAFNTLKGFTLNPVAPIKTIEVQNFIDAWEKANFSQYLLNSLIYTFSGTLIFVVSALFVAFPLARNYVKGSKFLLTLFVIALFLPPALIPQFQLILRLGLYNSRIGYIMLFLVNPIGIIILVNYVRSIPTELDEAAAIDGCSYFRFAIQILFPLIRPAVATVFVLHAIGIWNDIIAATIYLTSKAKYPITRGLIVFEGVYGYNWPTLAAAVLILTIPMLILYMFLQRYIISGLTQGSVKG